MPPETLKYWTEKYPKSIIGECQLLKLTWVVGKDFSVLFSESRLGSFLMPIFKLVLELKVLLKERRNK